MTTSECIPWNGFIDVNGYGKRGHKWAHRAVYASVHGDIPEGMEVMHLCNNKACVNIDHLKLGTHAENMAAASRDGLFPERDNHGEMNPNAKLNNEIVAKIREKRDAGFTLKELSQEFGVTISHVGKIVRGEAWL